jgi:hypothetical protein
VSGVHNALRRGPWGQAASAILGESRESTGIERLSESLSPVINLWSEDRPDWNVERLEQRVQLHGFQAAVAGEFSCIVFEAPPDDDSILIIDKLIITGTLQHLIGYDARPAGATESQLKEMLDQRARPNAAVLPRSRVFSDTNAATALTAQFFRFTGSNAGSTVLEVPFVLIGNNRALIVEVGTANSPATVTAFGRERRLLPSEKHLSG